jgi:hypothetical protein
MEELMHPRLGVLIPYRDRAEHLEEFLHAAAAFFRDDPLHATIEPRFLIVEQSQGLPFNRGALLNVGFQLLAGSVDYLCLHDVDRIPVSADYRWPERPTMIIRHGLPLPPEVIQQLLSSVVLIQAEHFVSANGFSNGYWGWGYEDVDLRERLLWQGLVHAHREGAFRSLPHKDLGSHADGTPTTDAQKNQAIFISRWFDRHGEGWRRRRPVSNEWRLDGLASLAFTTLSSLRPFPHPAASAFAIEHVVVDFPSP